MKRHGLVGTSRVHRLCALWMGLVVVGWAAQSPAVAPDSADADLKITQRTAPRFPDRALIEGAGQGEVRALLQVDETGRLKDLMMVAYTRKDFADALDQAVREWRFSPERRDGKAVPAVMEIECRFGIQGVVYVDRKTPGDTFDSSLSLHYAFQPCTLRDLDQPVQAVVRPAPVYPQSWSKGGLHGRVELEFYVDPSGRARFPSVVSAAHPALAAQALAAVEQWQFEPPLRHGQPVLVRTSQVFEFAPTG